MKKSKRITPTVTFQPDPDVYEALTRIAKERGKRTEIINRAIREKMDIVLAASDGEADLDALLSWVQKRKADRKSKA